MKVGFCVANYSERPVAEVVDLAAAKGYEAVELPAYTGNGQLDVDELLHGDGAAQLRRLVQDAGLVISGISNHADSLLVLGPHGRDTASICDGTPAEQIEFGTRSMLRTAQLANALEVSTVIAFSGVGNFGRFNDWPYPGGWADEEAAFVERWVPIFDAYRQYGVQVAFEPHPNNIVYDLTTTKRCLALCDEHPSFAINLDPANVLFMGLDVSAFVAEIGSRIVNVHAKDCEIVGRNVARGGLWMLQRDWGTPDRSFRFRVPGWGSVDWRGLITELSMAGFTGALSYEHEDVTMSRDDGTDKAIAFLQPLMIHAPYEGRTDKLFQQ